MLELPTIWRGDFLSIRMVKTELQNPTPLLKSFSMNLSKQGLKQG